MEKRPPKSVEVIDRKGNKVVLPVKSSANGTHEFYLPEGWANLGHLRTKYTF